MVKKLVSIALVLCLCIGLVGCGQNTKEAEPKQPTEAYKIGVLSIDDSLPFYVADKEGYFKKAGVDVKVIPFKSSSEESQALEAGELDMIMNDMVVQGLLAKGGVPTKIVATAYGATPKEGRFVVLAAPNSNITKPEDFYGKKIAISNNTMMEYLMNAYFKHLKLDLKKVELVNMPNLGTRMEALLAGKDIDGAILPDPLASLAIKKNAKAVIDDTTLTENFSQSVILVPDKVLKDRKEDTKKVMAAYFEAMNNINQDPEKFLPLEREFAHIPKPLEGTYPMPHYTVKAVPTEQEVERVQEWLVEKGLTKKALSYKDLVDTEFIGDK